MSEASIYGGLAYPHTVGVLAGTVLSVMLLMEIGESVMSVKKRSPATNTIQMVFAVSSIALLSLDWFSIYNVSIRHWNTPDYLQTYRLSDYLEPPLCAAVVALSQASFNHRASHVSTLAAGRWAFLIINYLLSGISFVSVILLQHCGLRHVSEDSIYTSTRALTLYWLLASSACDVMASLALFSSKPAKWKTFESSEDVGRYLLSTGVLNATISLTSTAIFLLASRTTFVPFADCLPRVAALSCVVAANIRRPRYQKHPGLVSFSKKYTPAATPTSSISASGTEIDPFTREFNHLPNPTGGKMGVGLGLRRGSVEGKTGGTSGLGVESTVEGEETEDIEERGGARFVESVV